MFNDHLPKFNTKNAIWSQFLLNEANGLLRGEFFHIILLQVLYWGSQTSNFDFKSYWKHCKGLHDLAFLSRFTTDDRHKVGWVEHWKVWVTC